jgi:hypothetical protein
MHSYALWCADLSHRHYIKKTHITFIEYDDVNFDKLADVRYFGEGNSKDRKLEYDFEYCLTCDLRLLNREPVMTRDILVDELERFVVGAKNGNYTAREETTMQHTDFEVLERLISAALRFGRLKENHR